MCISYVMPIMVVVLPSRSDCPLKVTGGCLLDSCLSRFERVIKDFCGNADILVWDELLIQLCM